MVILKRHILVAPYPISRIHILNWLCSDVKILLPYVVKTYSETLKKNSEAEAILVGNYPNYFYP